MAEEEKEKTVRSVRAAVKNFESIVDSQANNPDYRPPRVPPPPRGRSDLVGVSNGSPENSNLIGSSCGDVANEEDDDDSSQPMSLAERMEALRKSMRGKYEPRRSVDPIANRPIGSIKDHMRQSVDSFEKSIHPPDPSVRTVGDVRNALKFKEPEGVDIECDSKPVNRNSSVFEATGGKRNSDIFSDATALARIPPTPTPRKSKRKKESSCDDGMSGHLERSQSCDDLTSPSCEPILSPRSYHSQKGLDDLLSVGQFDDKLVEDFESKNVIVSPRRDSEVHTDRVQSQTTKSRKRSEVICDENFAARADNLSLEIDKVNEPSALSADLNLTTDEANVSVNPEDSFSSNAHSPDLADVDVKSDELVKDFTLSVSPNFDRLSKDSGIGLKSGSVENLSSRSSRSSKRNKASTRSRSALGEKSDIPSSATDWLEDFNQDLVLPFLVKEEQEFNHLMQQCNDLDPKTHDILTSLVDRKSALDYLLPLFKTHKEISSEENCPVDSTASAENDTNLFKTNLITKAEMKHAVLINEKSALSTRLSTLDESKSKLDTLMKSYAGARQYNKFRQIVEDLDKLLHLLNMLSERLARMYNNIWHTKSNTSSAAHNIEALNAKYEEQKSRFDEAVQLKENIDSRSHQMAQCAKNCLASADWSLYKQFFFDKYQLFIDQASFDCRINQSQAQISALRELLHNNSEF